MSIPRLLHQVWIGPKPIPSREDRWVRQMATINPGWRHVLHGNDALDRYRTDPYLRELQDRKEPWAFVSDRLRALILLEQGGVYLDADCQPVKPLSDLNRIWDAGHVSFVTAFRRPDKPQVALHRGVSLVDNTFMACAKGSKMIRRMVDLWRPSSVIVDGHGCGIDLIRNTDEETVWLNYRYFYSDRIEPETIVLHDEHNLATWVADSDKRKRIPLITAEK